MDKRGIRVVQLNCQNAYSVMCDLGNVAKKRRECANAARAVCIDWMCMWSA